MRKPDASVATASRGFTLVEILVSIVILMLVLVAVYSFFDQGQWLYVGMEKQTEHQQNVRIVVENLERELRMVGQAIPTSVEIGGTQMWTPFVFTADRSTIYFHADIDSRNTILTADGSSGTISVDDPAVVCPEDGWPLVLVEDLKKWQAVTCSGPTGTTIDVNPAPVATFAKEESTVFSPDTVFYRLTNDIDADGVCDDLDSDGITCDSDVNGDSRPDDDDYPFCEIERAEVFGNAPDTDEAVPADSDFHVVARNICKFQIQYFNADGTVELNSGTMPLPAGFLGGIQRIKITVTAKARSTQQAGFTTDKYNDVEMTSDILLRAAKY